MKTGRRNALALLAVLVLSQVANTGDHWPDFRGPRGDGTSDARGLPLRWSETENVAWSTPLPGRGWSSPVIWGDQIWMSTAALDGHALFALMVDKNTGKLLHHIKVFDVEKPQPIDPLNSYASPSPVIEPGRVYVHFGTYGTACLDTGLGKVLWVRRDFPVDHKKGPGASPVLWHDRLIFPCDGNDVQYVVALDSATGKTVWKTARSIDLSRHGPDFRKSFSTPLVVRGPGGDQVVTTAAGGALAYDPATGRELWKVRYGGHTNVSRPVASDTMVFVNTGYSPPQVWAIRRGGAGDVTPTHVAWKTGHNVPIRPSLALAEGLLYMISDSGGILTCLEAGTGQVVWKERLGGNYSASPLVADGRLYFFDHDGKTTVIKPGRLFQVLAVNRLADGFMASPAVSGQSLYLRTRTRLFRIQNH